MQHVNLPPALLGAIWEHAAAAYPHECCGFLVGWRDGERVHATESRRAANQCVETPRTGYILSPRDYLEHERRVERRGLEMIGFYHSHPDQPPAPSEADLQYAWPNMVYIVASLYNAGSRELGAFILSDDRSAFLSLPILEALHG